MFEIISIIVCIIMAVLLINYICTCVKVIEAQLNLVNANLDHVIASIDLMDIRLKSLGNIRHE